MSTESISITTSVSEGVITQRVTFDPSEEGHDPKLIMQQVMHLQDEATKQALIKMGWTPPGRIVLLPGRD